MPKNRAKNRRVDILVVEEKEKKTEDKGKAAEGKDNKVQEKAKK